MTTDRGKKDEAPPPPPPPPDASLEMTTDGEMFHHHPKSTSQLTHHSPLTAEYGVETEGLTVDGPNLGAFDSPS